MAIVKIIGNKYETQLALNNLCSYIVNPEKTKGWIGGRGVQPQSAAQEMWEEQTLWGIEDGRRAYHMIICFAEIELIYTQDAYDIAQDICKLLYPEYQVLFGVHCRKPKNMHIHFAINPVSMQTGRKLHLSYAYQWQLEKELAKILQDYEVC